MLKGAIVGFGFISGKGHHPAYLQRDDVEIVAVADLCPARLSAAAARCAFRAALPELAGAARQGARARLRGHLHSPRRARRDRARGAAARRARALREAAHHFRGAGAGAGRGGAGAKARGLPRPQLQARAGGEVRQPGGPLGPHRHGARRHPQHLPHHPRQGGQGVEDRLAAREEDLGRRHRHGPRLAQLLPDLRLAGVLAHRT